MSNCPICHPHLDPPQHIVPKQHRGAMIKLTPTDWSDTYTLLHAAKSFLEETYGPDGYTLGWNVGEASNQTIPRAHLHIIPRYAGGPHAGKGLRHWVKRLE